MKKVQTGNLIWRLVEVSLVGLAFLGDLCACVNKSFSQDEKPTEIFYEKNEKNIQAKQLPDTSSGLLPAR